MLRFCISHRSAQPLSWVDKGLIIHNTILKDVKSFNKSNLIIVKRRKKNKKNFYFLKGYSK